MRECAQSYLLLTPPAGGRYSSANTCDRGMPGLCYHFSGVWHLHCTVQLPLSMQSGRVT